ncbi:hypothetical protein FRC08_018789 [Ceratobasidium sp. 394]|nr:hypothetical protein FRC08_018789 [Ceratobasidium sp. 394]
MKVEVVIPVRHKSSTASKATIRPPSELPTEPGPAWMEKPQDLVTGRELPDGRPRRMRSRSQCTKQESAGDHWSDLDYTPDQSSSPGVSRKSVRKRRREPSPASSASSVSLGSTWYDSTKRRITHKPEYGTKGRRGDTRSEEALGKDQEKARARDYPGATYDKTLLAQSKPNLPPPPPPVDLPQNAHSDSGYLSESLGNSVASFSESNRALYSPLAGPSVATFHSDSSVGNSESTRTEGRAYSPRSISPTPEEVDEDSYVESMVDLESDIQATDDLAHLMQRPPQSSFLTPSSRHRGATVSPISSGGRQRSRHEAGSSTAPGTKEWHGTRNARGSLNYETIERDSPERTRFGKQVTFATGAGHPESTEPEQIDDRVSFPRSRSTSVLSSRFTPTPPSRRYSQSLETIPGSRRSEGIETEELFSEIEASYAASLQTPSQSSLLTRIPPKSSDMHLLSRLGLGVVLDRLGAKYGFTRELVGEVYSVEDGIVGTELVLKEMKAQVEEVLCRRASSVIEGDYA